MKLCQTFHDDSIPSSISLYVLEVHWHSDTSARCSKSSITIYYKRNKTVTLRNACLILQTLQLYNRDPAGPMEGNAAQHLQEDAWKSVAAFLVEKHAFRSVYDVNRDLASLQLVCKGSSQCADDAWKRVVELCAPSHVRVSSQPRSVDLLSKHLANHSAAPSRRALEAATRLPTDQLPVFLQRQADRYACIKAHAAMQSFGLAQQDLVGLQTVAIIRKKEKTYLKQVNMLITLYNTYCMLCLGCQTPLLLLQRAAGQRQIRLVASTSCFQFVAGCHCSC